MFTKDNEPTVYTEGQILNGIVLHFTALRCFSLLYHVVRALPNPVSSALTRLDLRQDLFLLF